MNKQETIQVLLNLKGSKYNRFQAILAAQVLGGDVVSAWLDLLNDCRPEELIYRQIIYLLPEEVAESVISTKFWEQATHAPIQTWRRIIRRFQNNDKIMQSFYAHVEKYASASEITYLSSEGVISPKMASQLLKQRGAPTERRRVYPHSSVETLKSLAAAGKGQAVLDLALNQEVPADEIKRLAWQLPQTEQWRCLYIAKELLRRGEVNEAKAVLLHSLSTNAQLKIAKLLLSLPLSSAAKELVFNSIWELALKGNVEATMLLAADGRIPEPDVNEVIPDIAPEVDALQTLLQAEYFTTAALLIPRILRENYDHEFQGELSWLVNQHCEGLWRGAALILTGDYTDVEKSEAITTIQYISMHDRTK